MTSTVRKPRRDPPNHEVSTTKQRRKLIVIEKTLRGSFTVVTRSCLDVMHRDVADMIPMNFGRAAILGTHDSPAWSGLRSVLFAWLVAASAASPALAQAPDDRGKLTFGDYLFADQSSLDVNVRYSLSDWTGWLGYYAPTDGARQGRVGIEYDLRTRWLFLVPSAQAASAGFYGGSVYSGGGGRLYLIGGASRPNLEPYWNLNFHP